MEARGSDRSVGVYEEDNKVDEKLLNKLSKWILYNRLPCLARNLGFTQAEITCIMVQTRTPEEQIFQVRLLFWKDGGGGGHFFGGHISPFCGTTDTLF